MRTLVTILADDNIKKEPSFESSFLVPLAGVEPARYRYRRILSPLRLPIPSQRHLCY